MKRVRRLRPSQALAGGGGRYRYGEVGERPPEYGKNIVCDGCGFYICACPTINGSRLVVNDDVPDGQAWGGAVKDISIAEIRKKWREALIEGGTVDRAEAIKPAPVEHEWQEVETASFDVVLRAWQVITTDGEDCLVYHRDMAPGASWAADDIMTGDTVAIVSGQRRAIGFNGELFR